MAVERLPDIRGPRLADANGLKASTELLIEACGEGSSLTIVDRYHPVTNADDERLVEVDRSLVPWLAAIRGHLSGLARGN